MLDLKKYFANSIKVLEARKNLEKLGFVVQDTIVSSNDPQRKKLIADLALNKITYEQFLDKAIKLSNSSNVTLDQAVRVNILYGPDGKKIIHEDIIYNSPIRPIKELSPLKTAIDVPAKLIQEKTVAAKQSECSAPPVKYVAGAPEPASEPEPEAPWEEQQETEQEIITVPQWRDLPPKDKEDWVEPNVCDYIDNGVWAIAAASRRGKTHAHMGTHRDDSYAFAFQEGWSIIAVADGAGSYRLSRVGAKIGCQKAVEHLKRCLKGIRPEMPEGAEIPEHSDLVRIKVFLTSAMKEVLCAVREEARRRNVDFDELSTTMLIALHHTWKDGKSIVASIQVGDGAIVIWHGGNVTVLGSADSGNYASETKFITSKDIEQEFNHRTFFTFKTGFDAVAVMTDGVSDDYFPPDKAMPKMFEDVYNILLSSDTPGDSLLNWLSYERRGSFDDRTIVVLHRR